MARCSPHPGCWSICRSPGAPRRGCSGCCPGSFSAVFAAAALLDGLHASHYAFYLPAGINVRLIKAALWLGLAALIAFYTALLHTLHRRRYGRRSRALLGLLVVASLYVMIERREAFHPSAGGGPLPSSVAWARGARLYVVGLDAATLEAVLPLAEQGRLPFFAEMLREGSYARLRTLTPVRRDPLWNSVATGKFPFKHGVVGPRVFAAPFLRRGAELRLLPAGLGFRSWGLLGASSRPSRHDDRQALPLWEILTRLEVPTLVVGWPQAAPFAAGPALAVSDSFFGPGRGPTSPADLARRADLFRVGAAEIDPTLLEDLSGQARATLVAALERDLWRETLAFYLLDAEEPRATFLLLPGLADVSRRYFGGYVRHDLEGVGGAPYALASAVLIDYYRHLDGYLAQLWQRDEGARLLAVVSAYGAASPPGWRRLFAEGTGGEVAAGDLGGASDGALFLRGAGVRAGGFVAQGGIEDVMPTLLYALGLPVARDLDGRVLTGVFDQPHLARTSLTFVPSYETLAPAGEPQPASPPSVAP